MRLYLGATCEYFVRSLIHPLAVRCAELSTRRRASHLSLLPTSTPFSSFLQSVCVLGYCLCPLNIASIVCWLWGNKIFQLLVVGFCFLWATRASVGFMSQLVPTNRKALGVYPVLLFYLTVSWMILVQ